MKKLYVVMPWFDVFAGGAEKALRDLAESISDYAFKVIILSTCSRSPYSDWFLDQEHEHTYMRDRLEVHKFSVDKVQDSYHSAVRKVSAGQDLTFEEKKSFFFKGFISSNLVQYLQDHLSEDDSILCGPYFQGVAHSVVEAFPGRVTMLPAFHDEEPFHWEPVESLIKNAKNFIFLSDKEKELVVSTYGAELGLSYQNWPILGLPVDVRSPRRKAFDEDMFVVYIGRFDGGKGLPQLIDWHLEYAKVRESNGLAPIKLKLIGKGDDSIIPSHTSIEVLGFLSDEDKISQLGQSVALVHLSPNESFSYSLMEAAGVGVPVIVSDKCAVTSDHARCSGGGWVAGCLRTYGQAVDQALDPKANHKAGEQGREFVLSRYSRQTVLDRYLEVISR